MSTKYRESKITVKYTDFQRVEMLHHPAASLHLRPHTRNNYQQFKNIVYAEAHGIGLVMDVFQPLSSPSHAAVIDIVSGGWHSDRTMLNEHIGFGLIDALCEQGITVFAVSPGSLPLFTGYEMVAHIYAAIRHIKGYASIYDVDQSRIGIMGVSAGGHLAALAALSPQEPRPHARDPWQKEDTRIRSAVLFFPPTDLLDYGGVPITSFNLEGLDLTRLLAHGGESSLSQSELHEKLTSLSPARLTLVQPPPFMIIQGKKDMVVPWQQAEKLATSLHRAGGEVELVYNDEGGHLWPGISKEINQAVDWLSGKLSVHC